MSYVSLIRGDVDGSQKINQSDVTTLVLLSTNTGGESYSIGKCGTPFLYTEGDFAGYGKPHPNTMIVKAANSYRNGESNRTLNVALSGLWQTKWVTDGRPDLNGFTEAYYSYAKDGYADYLGDLNNAVAWPNQADVTQLVSYSTGASGAGITPANKTHPSQPISSTASDNIVSITFSRSLKTLDDSESGTSVLSEANKIIKIYGGVRFSDFRLYNNYEKFNTNSTDLAAYLNPTSIVFADSGASDNDTIKLTFDLSNFNGSGDNVDKYWIRFIPRRDSENLGISLTFNQFVFYDNKFVKEGVFIHSFTLGTEASPLVLSQPTTNSLPSISSTATGLEITLGDTFTYEIQINDTDQTDTLTVSATVNDTNITSLDWATITDVDGQPRKKLFSATPPEIGTYTIVLTPNDGTDDGQPQEFTLTVNLITVTIINQSFDYTIGTGDDLGPITFTPVGASLSIESGNNNDYFAIDPATNKITVTEPSGGLLVGSYELGVKATLTNGQSPTATITIVATAPSNSAPEITSTGITTATVDVLYTYDIITDDADTGDNVTLAATTKPDWLTLINTNGVYKLEGTPTATDTGNNNVTLTATDGNGGSATQEFAINVLEPGAAVAMTVTVVDGKYVITDANNTAFTRSISLLHKTFEFDFTSAPGFQITDSNGDLNGTVVENKQTITVNSRTPTLYFSDSTNANTTGGVIYILPPWLGPPSQDQ